MDINEVAGLFAGSLLSVKGVYRTSLSANGLFHAHTPERPTRHGGFVFVTRGQAAFEFDGTRYELRPGSVAHGGPGMTLTIRTDSAELDYYLVHYAVHDTGPEAEGADRRHAHFLLEPGDNQKLRELLRQLHQSFGTPGSIPQIRTKQLLYSVLYELFACSRNRLNRESAVMIEQAIGYIHEHYMDPLNLQSLSEHFAVSAKSFAYLFNKYAGISPIDYLIQHRIRRADEMLAAGGHTIKQIAAGVGYGDPHYFSRLYKKHTGYAPSGFARIRQ